MVVKRRKKKSRADRGSDLESAAAEYRNADQALTKFRVEAAEVLSQLSELEDSRAQAEAQFKVAAEDALKDVTSIALEGYRVSKRVRKARKVRAMAVLGHKKYRKVWTHDGVVSIGVGVFDKLVASGVIDSGDADGFIETTVSESIHIEEE